MPGIRLLFNDGGEIIDLPVKTIDTINHTQLNNLLQQDITDLTFEPLNLVDIDAILDMTNITQQTIIRKLEQADNSNYEQVKQWVWPDDNDSINDEISGLTVVGHNVNVKFTMQSQVLEGSTKTVSGRKAIYTY